MTWRVPPYDRAVDELVRYVRATYTPLGIVVSGSIVRGNGGPTSDLDVLVVHGEAWRVREQKRFNGVPAELFIGPPLQSRRNFERDHADARPVTAHMFATGEVIEPSHPVIEELVREARDWLARPVETTELKLAQLRYGPVDLLDNARDLIDSDPAAAALMLGEAVRDIIAYAFWQRRCFLPRRKDRIAALASIDPQAAALVHTWLASSGRKALATVEVLANHVLAVDTFFEWTSQREPVAE
jgi:hypothetical protein